MPGVVEVEIVCTMVMRVVMVIGMFGDLGLGLGWVVWGGRRGGRGEGGGGVLLAEYVGRYYYKGNPLGKPKYQTHICV